MTESSPSHPQGVKVVHRLPHRTRLRVHKSQRNKMSQLSATLSDVPGVESVEVNHQTGSVLITHDPKPDIVDSFADALADNMPDLLLSLVGGEELELGAAGIAMLGKYIQGAAKHLDGQVSEATDNAVDLKTLVPLLFLGAGTIGFLKNTASWAAVPPIVLFYYAFDTYWKFNLPNTIEQEMRAELDARARKQQTS